MNMHACLSAETVLHLIMADCEDEDSLTGRLERLLQDCRDAKASRLILESRVQGCAMPCLGVCGPADFGARLVEAGITRLATVCEHGTFAYAGLLSGFRAAGGIHHGFFCAKAARAWLERE